MPKQYNISSKRNRKENFQIEIPKYKISKCSNLYCDSGISSIYRYACKEELIETIEYNFIRLKKTKIWKSKFTDEVYLCEWLQDKQNVERIFEAACEDISYTISLLTNKPSPTIQFHWLVTKLMKYVDTLAVSGPEENFAFCYTQNTYEQNMWNAYANDESAVCYETYADYFKKIIISNTTNFSTYFHSSFCDLWKMNYCSPDDCMREFIRDTENISKISNAFYLKDSSLFKEQEVRLNYRIQTDKNLFTFIMDSREKLYYELNSLRTLEKIKNIFIEYLSKYNQEYDNYLHCNTNKVHPILFEDHLCLELPTKISEYIRSIKTSPKASKEWTNYIQRICEVENINYIH